MPQHLSEVLNACERMGKQNVRGEDLRPELPHTSPEALRKELYHQQQAGRLVRLPRGSDHWLIVPLSHATAGSPPMETWLDAYHRAGSASAEMKPPPLSMSVTKLARDADSYR